MKHKIPPRLVSSNLSESVAADIIVTIAIANAVDVGSMPTIVLGESSVRYLKFRCPSSLKLCYIYTLTEFETVWKDDLSPSTNLDILYI
jgi:hypothetical protein